MALIEVKNVVTNKKVIDFLYESDQQFHQDIIDYFFEKFGLEKTA